LRLDNPHRNGPPEPSPSSTYTAWCDGAEALGSAADELLAACKILMPLYGDGINERLESLVGAMADVLRDVNDDRDAAGRAARRAGAA